MQEQHSNIPPVVQFAALYHRIASSSDLFVGILCAPATVNLFHAVVLAALKRAFLRSRVRLSARVVVLLRRLLREDEVQHARDDTRRQNCATGQPYSRAPATQANAHGVLSTISMLLIKPFRPELWLLTPSNRCVKTVGASTSPSPNESAAARTKRARRVKRTSASTRMPDVTTLANRNVVTPPSTGFGTGRTVVRACTGRVEGEERTSEKDAGDLAEHAEEDKEGAAPAPGRPIRAARDRDDAVVLRDRQPACTRPAHATQRTCANIESGVTVKSAERKPPRPSLCTHGQYWWVAGE
jgi:hypothetical protein